MVCPSAGLDEMYQRMTSDGTSRACSGGLMDLGCSGSVGSQSRSFTPARRAASAFDMKARTHSSSTGTHWWRSLLTLTRRQRDRVGSAYSGSWDRVSRPAPRSFADSWWRCASGGDHGVSGARVGWRLSVQSRHESHGQHRGRPHTRQPAFASVDGLAQQRRRGHRSDPPGPGVKGRALLSTQLRPDCRRCLPYPRSQRSA
jgi:hypothetical protein